MWPGNLFHLFISHRSVFYLCIKIKRWTFEDQLLLKIQFFLDLIYFTKLCLLAHLHALVLLFMFFVSTERLFILTWLGRTGRFGEAASRVQIQRSWWPSSEPLRPAGLPSLYTDPTLPATWRTRGGGEEESDDNDPLTPRCRKPTGSWTLTSHCTPKPH